MGGRYQRQEMVEGMDEGTQRMLGEARVAVVGMGGLGSSASMHLAMAGVGHITMVDDDLPDHSDLNRQITLTSDDVASAVPQIEAAKRSVLANNPGVDVETILSRVSDDNIGDLIGDCDIIVDGLNRFETRYLLNRYAMGAGKTYVHASVEGMSGQVTVIIPGRTPCLECIIPRGQPEREVYPVLGVTTGTFGALEAAEVIKMVTGYGEPLASRMLFGDIASQHWSIVNLGRSTSCPICSVRR